jgi:uncharacterized protein YjbI with pentapeptide repeats
LEQPSPQVVVCARCRVATTRDLAERDLAGAILAHADLRGVVLKNANLRGADLTLADLRGADLDGVDVHDANLDGARIDFVYKEFLTGRRLTGYRGTPDWHYDDAQPPQEGRFAVRGYAIRCPCCGGDWFVVGTALLETRGLAFFKLGWLAEPATVLTCKACSRMEWFRSPPVAR